MATLPPIAIDNFNLGGLADSKFSGVKHSLAKLIGFDLHSTPGLLKVRQKLTKVSSTTVDAFCKARVACSDGNSYFFSHTTGKVWKVTSAFAVSLVHTTTPNKGGAGCLDAKEYNGYIYWVTEKRLHRIPVSGTSDWATNAVEDWAEINLDQDAIGGTGFTYTLTTAINEGATHRQTYTPTKIGLEAVGVNIDTVGTGNWTVEVHNAANTVIGSKQILVASVTTGWNIFEFAAVVYPVVGSAHHVHIYSSVADGKVISSVASDLEGGNIKIYTTSDANFHPLKEQNLVLYLGDRSSVHQVDDQTFSLDALKIKPPLNVKCLGIVDTDLLIGTYIADNVSETRLFRWDTFSISFTSSDPIPENGINAFLEGDNYTIVNAGNAGNLYYYNGQQLDLFKKIPGDYTSSATALVNPNAVANLNGLILFGLSNVAGDPADEGVYCMGRNSKNYPLVMDLSFPISERLSSALVLTGVEIGAALVAGVDFLVSWKRKSTITVTIATPGVVTYTNHNITDGDGIVFTTTGALPTGITSGTIYYARSTGTNTLNLYDTSAHAVSGGATGRVDTSGSQSGVHTAATFGIDKLDYSNKLDGAYFESRVAAYAREVLQNFSKFVVAYETLPASTDITIQYKVNHGDYTGTNEKTDAQRLIKFADEESPEGNTVQMKVIITASSNSAPTIESAAIILKQQ